MTRSFICVHEYPLLLACFVEPEHSLGSDTLVPKHEHAPVMPLTAQLGSVAHDRMKDARSVTSWLHARLTCAKRP